MFEARTRAVLGPLDLRVGRAQVAAEAFPAHHRRQVTRQAQAHIAADRLQADLAAGGERRGDAQIAGHRLAGDLVQTRFVRGHVDRAGHGFHRGLAAEAAAQVQIAADRLRRDLGAVEGQVEVAADALDLRLARRAGDDHIAADAFDLELARGHTVDVDAGRHGIDVEFGAQRHGDLEIAR
ncbi:hypothetical protein CATMIT_01793, partial [Catenibacterium mitsuokai DSM 15897]